MVRVLDIDMRDICEMGDICDIILWVWHDPEMICRAEQEHNIFLQSCTAKTESMGPWGIKWGGRDIWAESVLQGPYKQPCEGHTSRPSNPMRARHQLKSAQVTTSNSCRTKLEQPVLVYCDSGGRRIRVIWRMLPLFHSELAECNQLLIGNNGQLPPSISCIIFVIMWSGW